MDRDIAAICLVPPGNIARELVAFKRRLFRATGEALALSVPETAILLSVPWEPGFADRDGRRRIKAVFESAWKCMEGQFRFGKTAVSSGWLVLSMENLPPAMMERLSGVLGEEKPSFEAVFPRLPAFPLFPIRDEAGDLSPATGFLPPEMAFSSARLALFRFRLSEGMKALAWTSIVTVRRKTGRTTAG